MKDGQQKPSGLAHGVAIPGGRRQVVIKMDTDQFDEIRTLAEREGISVSHQIRLLLEWGLEAAQ